MTKKTPSKFFRFFILLLAVGIFLPGSATPTWAAFDMFLHIEGIPGESKDAEFRDTIDILAFSKGIIAQVTNTWYRTSERPQFTDATFTKFLDKSSPILRLYTANGARIPRAILFVRKAGENPLVFWEVEFKNIVMTSAQEGASLNDERPTEAISFAFEEITWQYIDVSSKGGGETFLEYWNIVTSTGSSGSLNDRDGDGVPDSIDNCPSVPNANQADSDGDGIGNACDNPTCGNGVKESGEECDDHNLIDGDGCSSSCTLECQPEPELCNNIDEDCDDLIDEGCFLLNDGDGDTDGLDLAGFSMAVHQNSSKADLDDSGFLTPADIAIFANQYGY